MAPTLELALIVQRDHRVLASVEAEYGNNVVLGEFYTLAHHAKEYRMNPAPCNNVVEPLDPNLEGVILISHIDLDTLLGVYYLLRKKDDPIPEVRIRKAAELIDVGGYHWVYELEEDLQRLFKSIMGLLGIYSIPIVTTDVTEIVLGKINTILAVLVYHDPEIIKIGKAVEELQRREKESCFQKDLSTNLYRVFKSHTLPCTDRFHDPQTERRVPFVINYRSGPGAFFLASFDSNTDCDVILQSVWGKDCGGHARAAGSPRGIRIAESDLPKLTKAVERYVRIRGFIRIFVGDHIARKSTRKLFQLISRFKGK